MPHFHINTVFTGIFPLLAFYERKWMSSCRDTKKILLGGFICNTIYKTMIYVAKHLPSAVSDKEA